VASTPSAKNARKGGPPAYTISLHVAVKITESYINYVPPADYGATVKRLLATVPEKYLVGLDSVVLCNLSGQSRKLRTRKERLLGRYRPKWRGEKACIQLFVDQIQMPRRSFRWIRLLQDLMLGRVLYHELGHHVHTLRPEYREEEHVADDWGTRFSRNHLRRTYWYLFPALWAAVVVEIAFWRGEKNKHQRRK
jgi:hypothetical protein